jgi:uncharacterized protein YggT (Ycf19 family)
MLIVGLFYYSKLSPHKDRLTGRYQKIFNFFDRLYTPILNLLRKISSPAQVGNGIAVDMSQIILLLLLLLLFKLI